MGVDLLEEPEQAPDDERARLVRQAVEKWIAQLIDLSRRNNLIYFKPLRTGTLELTDCDDQELDGLLHGKKLPLSVLVDAAEETEAAAKLQEIRRRALANLEEKGLETLFLAVGMATWAPADGGRPPESPILLLPMEIEGRGRETRTLTLRRSGEAQVNPVLLHVLNNELGVTTSAEDLLSVEAASLEEGRLEPEKVFRKLASVARAVRGFSTGRKVVLGNFSFQKMAMVKDLRENFDALVAHDLIASIAGDSRARESIQAPRSDVPLDDLDKIPADEEFLVLDADSSQQRVIRCVQESQDGVIQGPPGTGKSQTIANLIAALAVQGKKVLFVAEKRAALEVVLGRLERLGLSHLALDLHGAATTRREVMQKIAESLEIIRGAALADVSDAHRKFEDRRAKLNAHAARMHRRWPPAQISVYELQGRLLKMPSEARSTLRWRGEVLDALSAPAVDAIKDDLSELGAGFTSLFLRRDPSPWNGALAPSGAEAQNALRTARELANEGLPELQGSLAAAVAQAEIPLPTVEACSDAGAVFLATNKVLDMYEESVFQTVDHAIVDALSPAGQGVAARCMASCFSGRYRAAKRAVAGQRKTGKAAASMLLADARQVLDLAERWTSLGASGIPCRVQEAARLADAAAVTTSKLRELESVLCREIDPRSLDGVIHEVARLAEDEGTVVRLPKLHEIEQRLADAGMGTVVQHIRTNLLAPSTWGPVVEFAWLSSMLDRVREEDSSVAGFDGRVHDDLVAEFKELDRARLNLAVARVRRHHAERAIATRNTFREQDHLVGAEARKKTRHLPLRKTFEQASDVLTALRPCWMASPLTVSQLLGPARAFDIVIFDEASQVLPHDAIPSLMRAGKSVVAGDKNQLPPTTFFFFGGDDDESAEDAGAAEGFESLLDLLSSFLDPWSLDWHYRSRSEELISFSNHHIYGDRLVTFPSTGGTSAITHELVEAAEVDGQEESSSPEVERVVKLVLDHAGEMVRRSYDDRETLGVIAMGIKHATRIQTALDEALRDRPELDEFFDLNASERFFVKNLERVQGDERDVIILSVGYGKDASGKLPYRFGPLLRKGGERRLNVAVTRARSRTIVVSSFSHLDMDPSRSTRRGVELLRLYLHYAASNGTVLNGGASSGMPLNEFETDVKEALEDRGLQVLPQWGASHYRIDLVAAHPRHPGQFVLAIECDGASYHSAPTARDRDRLRQQHLEALGWRFHRIWSTDWFMRRDDEIKRALDAFDRAVEASEGDEDEGPPPAFSLPNPLGGPSGGTDHGRSRRPSIRRGLPIGDYSDESLRRLLQWIKEDGELRTDEELLQAMIEELGYRRRGARIEARLRGIIQREDT